MKVYKIAFLTAVLVVGIMLQSTAKDSKDSAIQILEKITAAFNAKHIAEPVYFDSMFVTISLLHSNGIGLKKEEISTILPTYREAIWRYKQNEKHKENYYVLLCNLARFEGRNGEMLYYAEKLNELALLRNDSFSVSSIFFIANYYYEKFNFIKTVELYNKYQSFIKSIPQLAANKKLERRELMRSGDLLSSFCCAAYNSGDLKIGKEVEGIMQALELSVKKAYPEDTEIWSRLQYSINMAQHEKNRSLKLKDEIWKSISQLDKQFIDPNTPEYLKGFIEFTVIDKKALFYLDYKENDSAEIYVNLLKILPGFVSVPMNAYMIKKYEARLLYNRGFFKASEDSLVQALVLLEKQNVVAETEVDELIYTLTKVEEQQLLLNEARIENDKKERQVRFIILSSVMFLLLSVGATIYFRQRQKRKFLEYKLSMARNIHDETGPALLYAKSLVKYSKDFDDNEQVKTELEHHLDNTMAVIRSLSHDLKSHDLQSIGSLIAEIESKLQKLKNLNIFNYELKENRKVNRFISYYQFSQLKAILQECITNSIKHAQFDQIIISFLEIENKLTIIYSDNGSGWNELANSSSGIGMDNIKERIGLINGEIEIDNRYPEGYSIRFVMPLR